MFKLYSYPTPSSSLRSQDSEHSSQNKLEKVKVTLKWNIQDIIVYLMYLKYPVCSDDGIKRRMAGIKRRMAAKPVSFLSSVLSVKITFEIFVYCYLVRLAKCLYLFVNSNNIENGYSLESRKEMLIKLLKNNSHACVKTDDRLDDR